MNDINHSRDQERRRLKSLTISRMVYAAKQRNNEMAEKLKKNCEDAYQKFIKEIEQL